MRTNHILTLAILLTATVCMYAQPTVTPGAGYSWIMTGTSSHTSAATTSPASPSSTIFGEADTDPADCSMYCGGSCDGDPLLEKLVFGGTSLPAASCEQRVINLTHWTNTNPESALPPSPTSGTVHIPQDATLELLSAGTKIGGEQNKGFIIGGNGPGNFSEFDTRADYSLGWHVSDYSLSGASCTQSQQFAWNWGEPGGGTQVEMSGWNGYSTASFEMSFGESFSIGASMIEEGGGTLEVILDGTVEMFVSRNYGNADGKVQTVPRLEGSAQYTVPYEIWELMPVLPVQLISFDAHRKDGEVELSWLTASEVNSDYFAVQRSKDGKQWTTIVQVPSAGNSDREQTYTYTDAAVREAVYYRLQQVDVDGAYTYSPIVHVNHSAHAEYIVYPNPTRDQLLISDTNDGDQYQVLSKEGQLMQQGSAVGTIDISALTPDVYLLILTDAYGKDIRTERLVKL